VPTSESLEQCSARMLPFLHDVLLRDVRVAVDARDAQEASSGMRDAAPIFVVASSENLIRAIVGEWEGLNEEELAAVDVPYATPLVYQLDEDLVRPSTDSRCDTHMYMHMHMHMNMPCICTCMFVRCVRACIMLSVLSALPGAHPKRVERGAAGLRLVHGRPGTRQRGAEKHPRADYVQEE